MEKALPCASHTAEPSAAPQAPGITRVTELVQAEFAFVWRVLRRLGLPRADADDAAQRVFIVLSARAADVQPGAERAFLFRTAVNVAYKVRRSRGRRPAPVSGDSDASAHPGLDPEQALLQREACAQLDELLEQMPTDLRVVFVSYEVEQMTMAEIAQALELAPGTVASRLRRAREDFMRRHQRQQRRT